MTTYPHQEFLDVAMPCVDAVYSKARRHRRRRTCFSALGVPCSPGCPWPPAPDRTPGARGDPGWGMTRPHSWRCWTARSRLVRPALRRRPPGRCTPRRPTSVRSRTQMDHHPPRPGYPKHAAVGGDRWTDKDTRASRRSLLPPAASVPFPPPSLSAPLAPSHRCPDRAPQPRTRLATSTRNRARHRTAGTPRTRRPGGESPRRPPRTMKAARTSETENCVKGDKPRRTTRRFGIQE